MNVKKSYGVLLALELFLLQAPVFAVFAASTGLPWETPLKRVADSLSGQVALSVSIIAIMTAGGILVFGGDLNEFARRSTIVVLAIALLIGSANFISILFGISGALF